MKSAICILLCAALCAMVLSSCSTPSAPSESMECGLFVPILNAYAELERSDFEVYDEDLIGGLNFASYKSKRDRTTIVYAFYDLNQDNTKELLVGTRVKLSDSEYESVYGIFALHNGIPAPVFQEETGNSIYLCMDDKGHPVIECLWGRMDVAEDFFYTIDDKGNLKALEKLFTNGCDRTDEEKPVYDRAREMDGEQIDITEEEYCSLVWKYGGLGYGIGRGEPVREITLAWQPIHTIRPQ